MNGQPEPPFILVIGDVEEIQMFDSLGHVLGDIEYPEVEEGIYELYDSAGRKANLSIVRWHVVADGWNEDAEGLRQRVARYLDSAGASSAVPVGELSLPELITVLTQHMATASRKKPSRSWRRQRNR